MYAKITTSLLRFGASVSAQNLTMVRNSYLHIHVSIGNSTNLEIFAHILCLLPCSLAVPILAGWVYVFCGSMSRNI